MDKKFVGTRHLYVQAFAHYLNRQSGRYIVEGDFAGARALYIFIRVMEWIWDWIVFPLLLLRPSVWKKIKKND